MQLQIPKQIFSIQLQINEETFSKHDTHYPHKNSILGIQKSDKLINPLILYFIRFSIRKYIKTKGINGIIIITFNITII